MQKKIVSELERLMTLDDIQACMIVTKGLKGVMPEKMKVRDPSVWLAVRQITDQIFSIIDKFYNYKLQRFYFELEKYTVIIIPISRTFSLVVLIPSLANLGMIDVEIENTKIAIEKLIEKKD